jgi:hypothetical protein
VFSVLCVRLFIRGPAKHRRMSVRALRSVYIRLVPLLGEVQHGAFCRHIQVEQTKKLCHSVLVVSQCHRLYKVVA